MVVMMPTSTVVKNPVSNLQSSRGGVQNTNTREERHNVAIHVCEHHAKTYQG